MSVPLPTVQFWKIISYYGIFLPGVVILISQETCSFPKPVKFLIESRLLFLTLMLTESGHLLCTRQSYDSIRKTNTNIQDDKIHVLIFKPIKYLFLNILIT